MERPWVHINCASTLDGKIARPDGSRLRISGPWDILRVHRLRAELGAILVGAGTITADDPKLRVKEEIVHDPPHLTKIVLDGTGKVPASSRFLRTGGRSVILTTEQCDPAWYETLLRTADKEGLDLEVVRMSGNDTRIDLQEALGALLERGVRKVLVEGGSETISEFVRCALFDRFTIYFGPIMIGGNGPTIMGGFGLPDSPLGMHIEKVEKTPDGGLLVEFGLPAGSQ
ncbi:MAG: RibD family protein [Thermoplasmatota archaeon]